MKYYGKKFFATDRMMKKVLVALILVLLILLVIIPSKSNYESEPLPKIVWLLWLQGWDQAPWVPRQVAESWKKFNPGWDVRMIDRETCPVEIHGDTPQAQADVIRLGLLSKYGGVWADSTMLCMQSLDNWIHEAVEPAGQWMYRGGGNCEMCAIWFIISKPGNYMTQKWLEASLDHWKTNTTSEYYLTDQLWAKLYETDPKFKEDWAMVPKICCEDKGQAHMLAGKVGQNDPELKEILKTNPPRALKLDKAAIDENSTESNGYYAIQLALS